MNVFFGEVPLCYTNSVAMTLSSYGYDFHPEYLEAIMAMGNGANFVNNDRAHPIVFFDNGEPDISISNCLRILGFEYEEFFLTAPDEVNVNMIKEKLKFYLKNGSIIAGPLDMGYLTYNPNHVNLKGVDHFVAIYDLVENSKKTEQDGIVNKEKLYNLLYKLKLRSRGAKIVGLIFSLFKEDFININGLDEKYIGYGYEDDDFGNRFFKYGGETFVFKMKMYPIHMYHKAAILGESPNEDYYRQRKIEISKKNYRCEYGYDKTFGEDKYKVIEIK